MKNIFIRKIDILVSFNPGFRTTLPWGPFLEGPEKFAPLEIKAVAKPQSLWLQSCFNIQKVSGVYNFLFLETEWLCMAGLRETERALISVARSVGPAIKDRAKHPVILSAVNPFLWYNISNTRDSMSSGYANFLSKFEVFGSHCCTVSAFDIYRQKLRSKSRNGVKLRPGIETSFTVVTLFVLPW